MSGDGGKDAPTIAIVGMAGRFPGARDVGELWDNLRAGRESITSYSNDELRALGVDRAWFDNPSFVPARPYLDGRELFDAGFFGYSAQEAELIDPQQRLFLEVGWEALETAGYMPDKFEGLIGVYAGSSQNTYLWFNLLARPDFFERYGLLRAVVTNSADYLSSRLAYKLDLRGPSVTVQTACSTSLVAMHMACQGLLNFECDMALAGGVSLRVTPIVGYLYEPGGLLSRDGHCRTFDAAANGTVFGDGVGIVVLKRLEDALRDGDTIHAVVLGSAVNNDGGQKAGFTAPSSTGQAAVVFQAIEAAGVSADSISYVEAHGTGTELGDPVEVKALTKAFRASSNRRGFCALGSVKSNFGHLDAAAGVTGVIKTVLAMKHRELPPTLHFDRPNPGIDFDGSPFVVNGTLRPWTSTGLRRAGVHAFGMGGTNAFTVLEEAPVAAGASASRPVQLLLMSARTAKSLAAGTARLGIHLRAEPDLPLADAAYTLTVGRRAFQHRTAVVARCASDAAARLDGKNPTSRATGAAPGHDTRVAFLFAGEGAQHVQMARGLYDQEPRFCARVDDLCATLRTIVGWDLRTWLYPAPTGAGAAATRLDDPDVAQPALFIIELALAELWIRWGVTPHAMLGRGVGEYVAATLCGVFTWKDALRLVAARGQLMSDSKGDAFAVQVAAVPRQAPSGRWVSSLTGTWVTPAQATDPAYWAQHVREPGMVVEGVAAVLSEADVALLEVGPGDTLSGLAAHQAPRRAVVAVASLREHTDTQDDLETMLLALGRLWTLGVPVDWTAFWEGQRRARIPLPTYAFDSQRYWLEAGSTAVGPSSSAVDASSAREPAAYASFPGVPGHVRPDLATSYAAPRTEDERRLVAAWQDVLGVQGIGIHDNFFELGGDSLVATSLIARLRDATGREYSLRDVLEKATIAAFASMTAGRPDDQDETGAALLEELASLTEEEAAARLRAILGGEDTTSLR